MSEIDYRKLRVLISEAAEKSISKEHMAQLNRMLLQDENARRYYQEYILNSVILSTMYSNEKSHTDPNFNGSDDENQNYILKLAELELNAPEVEIDEEKVIEKPEIKVIKPKRKSRFFVVFDKLIYSAAAILIVFIAYAELFAPDYSVKVATVIDQIGVNWANNSQQLANNERVLTNQAPYVINSGIVKLKYDQGVDVLIEGPAKFVIERNGLYVDSGRVYSLVSSTGKGFTIDTASARYIDLGTEFGIDVSKTGYSELHVMTGKVQLFAGAETEEKISQLVFANNAVKYQAGSNVLETIPVRSETFVRDIDSSKDLVWHGQMKIDLADFVGGGNGFGTGRLNYGIMVDTAKLSNFPLYVSGYNNHPQLKDRFFKPVPEVTAIDGIFVPDGGRDKVVISSNGDSFSECPDTNATFCVPIINGGQYEKKSDSCLQIDGQPYGSKNKPSLFMHANCGITYDMNIIRKSLPQGAFIASFVSKAGSPDNPDGEIHNVDLWVLVDGKLKYSQTDLSTSKQFDIDIPLQENDRFLSLVVTQGKRVPGETQVDAWDWLLFGEPELTLQMK